MQCLQKFDKVSGSEACNKLKKRLQNIQRAVRPKCVFENGIDGCDDIL